MVKHVILWKLKESYSAQEKKKLAEEARARFATLNGRLPGMISIEIRNEPLPSSSCDMMLDSSFEDEAALAAYQKNPLHLEQAAFIRSIVESRVCFDYTLGEEQ